MEEERRIGGQGDATAGRTTAGTRPTARDHRPPTATRRPATAEPAMVQPADGSLIAICPGGVKGFGVAHRRRATMPPDSPQGDLMTSPAPRVLASFLTLALAAGLAGTAPTGAAPADDKKAVAALDTQYQEAVKKNDAKTMDRILLEDMVLVVGSGKVFTRADLMK